MQIPESIKKLITGRSAQERKEFQRQLDRLATQYEAEKATSKAQRRKIYGMVWRDLKAYYGKKFGKNPSRVRGRSTTLWNMASVTIRKLPNGVVKITGRKMRRK